MTPATGAMNATLQESSQIFSHQNPDGSDVFDAIGGFAAVEDELEQAAAIDGASRWQVFRLITLPLASTALLSGTVLAWARAMGEFGATIIFAGNFPGRTQTMPLAIYLGFELDLNVALTLSVILIGGSFLVLVLVKLLLGREKSDA